MQRDIFDSDHGLFRETARRFIHTEIVPNVPEWEHEGKVDKRQRMPLTSSGAPTGSDYETDHKGRQQIE
jgi:hypothetical protein